MPKTYDAVLRLCTETAGIDRPTARLMFEKLNYGPSEQFLPMETEECNGAVYPVGFLTVEAAEKIGFFYGPYSAFSKHIVKNINDMDFEKLDGTESVTLEHKTQDGDISILIIL